MLPAFGWQAVLTQWEFAPVVTAAVLAAGALYLWGAWRVRRRHPAGPWPWWRTGMFLAGLAVVVIATQSGIGAYDDVLFWDHMIQHLLLIMVAPPLLVVGEPFTLLLHASRNPLHSWAKRVIRSRVVSFLTWPPFGLVAYIVTIVATHLTGLTALTLRDPLLHDAEHVLYLVVGYLFFLPLLGREPISVTAWSGPRLIRNGAAGNTPQRPRSRPDRASWKTCPSHRGYSCGSHAATSAARARYNARIVQPSRG